eukprot:CAMPEP_0170537552 /NCGR_PEP_ID=MMETSP0209-20121228/102785_1 /TAXON_ID=665100 ORGANISM="Litonotus pictus, Strain P1" /NCGR_SAMPLE_ID=MMETSP0209 /ASSEMBLY_ACC=CAM_ASM_000301 /LENGTH=190 /DNA_ID=CAMNT_0010839075 /DNA_START=439 /DNA_END=1007 /DNA_ORIENTATION=-
MTNVNMNSNLNSMKKVNNPSTTSVNKGTSYHTIIDFSHLSKHSVNLGTGTAGALQPNTNLQSNIIGKTSASSASTTSDYNNSSTLRRVLLTEQKLFYESLIREYLKKKTQLKVSSNFSLSNMENNKDYTLQQFLKEKEDSDYSIYLGLLNFSPKAVVPTKFNKFPSFKTTHSTFNMKKDEDSRKGRVYEA